ncbi:MAG: NAD-dependent epimerase/dehydratase family protein [Candidatus Zixiibacteriota bacterium]
MKYLVTGGAGFIGSNVVNYLIENGDQVRVLDNFSTGNRTNLVGVEKDVEILEGDIRDLDTVLNSAKGMDYVLHLAALASVPLSIKDPITSHEVNVIGTLNVLEASRRANVRKVVSSSSSSVYGATFRLPIDEDTEAAPLSPYAVGKLTGEYYVRMYWELYKLPTVSLRSFNVYGPNQSPESDYAAVIPKFVHALLNDKRPLVYGDGEQTRDFIYVADAVKANILAATNDKIIGTEYNVASGQRHSLNKLLSILKEIIGSDIDAEYTRSRLGDIHHSCADINKLKARGFEPAVKFKDGLNRTVDFIESRYPSSKLVFNLNREMP